MKRDTEPGLMSAAPKGSGSVAAVSAGLLAVIISYAGPLAIFFQAAHTAHVGNDVIASWVWSISMRAAVSGIALSLWLKQPIITAWSAPGTALLVSFTAWLLLSTWPRVVVGSPLRTQGA